MLKGAIVACLMLAALGVVELATGHAKVGILVAVFIEVALVLGFLVVRFNELANCSITEQKPITLNKKPEMK